MFTKNPQRFFIVILALFVVLELGVLSLKYSGRWNADLVTKADSANKTGVVITSQAKLDEVQSILKALTDYKDDYFAYPRTLGDLIPDYLVGASDRRAGFSAYRYVPIGDPVSSFTLIYALDQDYAGLAKGAHIAGPAGPVSGQWQPSGSDLDNDGIDDAIEIYIYRTDSQDPDSDGDGFSDGLEIETGHNPMSK